MDAYLDIETTGLSPWRDSITVFGIYRQVPAGYELIQIIGNRIDEQAVMRSLEGVRRLYTYNGTRFDLVFIEMKLGIPLGSMMVHRDLMYDCWNQGLRGGFKAVEHCLGIPRKLRGVDGRRAVELWWRYVNHDDPRALQTLLKYNREDVENLKELRDRLRVA
jgi:uncharacterized protein YprB with RNaseH-like and TPR domain